MTTEVFIGKGKSKGCPPPPPPSLPRPPPKTTPTARTWPKVKVLNSAEDPPPLPSDGNDSGGVSVALADAVSVSERAQEIFSREPVAEKRPAVLASPNSIHASYDAAHGTTLGAALSAFRNTNGQLVPVKLLEQLGNLRTTGATPDCYLEDDDMNELRHVVFAADLQFGDVAIKTAERYALNESGVNGPKLGSRAIRRSEAALIPVVLIGKLVDPKGMGERLNRSFEPLKNPSAEVLAGLPAGHPLHGMTPEDVKMSFAGQIIGEWFDIRMLFVAHPTDPKMDMSILDLVKELLSRAAAESGCDFDNVRVGALRNLVAFKDASSSVATCEDFHRLLYEATAPLSQPHT